MRSMRAVITILHLTAIPESATDKMKRLPEMRRRAPTSRPIIRREIQRQRPAYAPYSARISRYGQAR
jgi:hypothetical protein